MLSAPVGCGYLWLVPLNTFDSHRNILIELRELMLRRIFDGLNEK